MDFASVAWWLYALFAAIGLGFGILQSWLMKLAAMGDRPRKWLYAVKFALWAVVLVVLALYSLPLLVVTVAAATLSLLIGSALMYMKAQREAR